MEEKNKTVLLIEIIVSLILALAFFSNYAINNVSCSSEPECPIRYEFMLIFLLGILTIVFLYHGYSLNKDFLLNIGYSLSVPFFLVFLWLILGLMIYDGNYGNLIDPTKSTTLGISVIIWLVGMTILYRKTLLMKLKYLTRNVLK